MEAHSSIIVVGCGRVGSELAIRLQEEGHQITVIDKHREAFRRLPASFDGQTVEGYGFDRDTLDKAGVTTAYALAAVTSGDNSNILTARIARERFEVPHVVARIYDPRRAIIYQRLGIQTVATVTWTTQQVIERIFPERSGIAWSDPSGVLVLIERALPPSWAGKALHSVDLLEKIELIAVVRAGKARFAPASLLGQEGDRLLLLVRHNALENLDLQLEVAP
ncbi:MAG: potassium channel family protein [Ferrimicrobium sp.]